MSATFERLIASTNRSKRSRDSVGAPSARPARRGSARAVGDLEPPPSPPPVAAASLDEPEEGGAFSANAAERRRCVPGAAVSSRRIESSCRWS